MKRPLVIVAVLYALGIFCSYKITLPLLYLFIILVALFILCLIFIKRHGFFTIFLSLFIFFLGITALKNAQTLSQSHISKFISSKEPFYIIKGSR